MCQPKATFVKNNVSGTGAHQKLYRTEPPVQYGEDDEKCETEWLLVSAVIVLGEPEAYLFPADEDGNILNWTELPGSRKGTLNHNDALEEAGYAIA